MDTTAEDMNKSEDKVYSDLSKNVNAIAKPLASRKLCKGLYKITGKAAKHTTLRRGVKEVTKAIRKGEKGIIVLAGDVTPIDVYSHLPVFCEENDIPYCYVPSRQDLGEATQTKRPTCAVMIECCDDFRSKYDHYHDQVKSIAVPF